MPDDHDAGGPDGRPMEASRAEPLPAVRRGTVEKLIAGFLVLALLLVGAFAVSQAVRFDDLQAEADRREAVSQVVAAFGEVYLTHDPDEPGARAERIADRATTRLAEAVAAGPAGVDELGTGADTAVEAEASEVFVAELAEGAGEAIVLVDIAVTTDTSERSRITEVALAMELVREEGRWLVDAVEILTEPELPGDDEDTTGTTEP